MTVVVDMQGFKGLNNKFIAKEIAVLYNESESQHFIIKPPFKFAELPPSLQTQARWLYNNYHGLSWEGGNVSFTIVKQFLTHNLRNKLVYVKGPEKRKWLTDTIGDSTKVADLDEVGCPNLHILKKTLRLYS